MDCKYTVNLEGKQVELFSTQNEINSLEDLIFELKKNIDSSNLAAYNELKNKLLDFDNIQDLNLNDINENTVGVYSPGELVKQLSPRESGLLRLLNIGVDWKTNNVIAGFGEENVPTSFYKGHIFFNLNYMNSTDNNIIALVELALYNAFGEINFRELVNSEKEEDKLMADKYLESIIKTKDEEKTNDLKKIIYTAYYRSVVKSINEDRSINTERLSLHDTWNKFKYIDNEERLSKHLPKSRINILDLKQGDLVLIPNPDKISNPNATDWYELFYDSYIDSDGKYIIRTLGQNTQTGNLFLRNRIASEYIYTIDNKLSINTNSNSVEAMVYTDEIYNNYSYTKSEKIPISLHKHFKSVSYKHILNLLKNNNILVTLDHKDYKIKEIRGSIIVLDNNKSLRIDEIKNIKLPVPNLELLEENIDMNYKTPTIGERALISIGNSKFIGLIIGNEFVTNKFLYIYKDDKGYKLGVTSQYNIVGTEIPRNTNQNIINNDDLINISYYINNILKNNKSVQSILEKDYDRLNNLTFNVSDLNNYSTILSDDILYNPETKLLYKVIDSGYNLINGIKHFYIKTVVKMSDNTFRYFNIDRNSLHNYILFTKRLNESFANLSIQKSRIEVFREPQVQSKSYVEVKVYKNPNNFIFILPANVNPIESNIAEKGYKDITQEYKKLMQDRYKWENIPDKLYAIATNNYYKKDSLNTNFVEMSKENFIKMLRSNELYKIIPGSFISLGKNVLVVEKILKNALVATKYSYTKIPNGNGEFRYVKGETVILDEYTDLNIKGIFTPKWAINTYEFISKYKNNIEKEETKINVKSSSYEFLVNFSNYLSEKFNIKINLIKNSDLERFNNPKVYQASSFTTFDEIYINLDKARITDPLHELLHVILATMKARNSDMYYRIINSVQYHPIFKEVAGNMINAEALEESFIKLFTLTFNKNIKSDGIFSDDGFNTTIKDTISDMLNLEENLDWEDVNGLMKTSIYDVLTNFGSKLIDGEESLIDFNSSYEMFTVADIIQKLIDEKKLEQKCNY